MPEKGNGHGSCGIIWSTVGVMCPAWSSGVDKARSSQYFDSLLIPCLDVLRC
jgi:hypothetical protein